MKIRVYHGYYGCDTGCCGHWVEVEGDSGGIYDQFEFGHPGGIEDKKAYARELIEPILKRHYPQCIDTIDWDTIDISGVTGFNDCVL